jgi:hypothetical protein
VNSSTFAPARANASKSSACISVAGRDSNGARLNEHQVFFLPPGSGVDFAFVRLDAKGDADTGSLGLTALGFFGSRLLRFWPFDMLFPGC